MAVLGMPRSMPLIRLDRRTLLALGLAAVAVTATMLATRPTPLVPVLVAAEDLPAGVPLGELTLSVRHLPDAQGLVQGDQIGELEDWSLAAPLREGEPLLPSLLRPPARQEAPDLMALTLEEAHAVLGRLNAGDRVDVYVTWPATGTEPPRTELLAREVYVVEARPEASGLGGRPEVELLVAVDGPLAARLAAALRSGELDLVRVGP